LEHGRRPCTIRISEVGGGGDEIPPLQLYVPVIGRTPGIPG